MRWCQDAGEVLTAWADDNEAPVAAVNKTQVRQITILVIYTVNLTCFCVISHGAPSHFHFP